MNVVRFVSLCGGEEGRGLVASVESTRVHNKSPFNFSLEELEIRLRSARFHGHGLLILHLDWIREFTRI